MTESLLLQIKKLMEGRRVVVLTGAGCSTESGIPDYRGPETRRRARNPIQYQAFIRDAEARARYWARSAVGWPRMAAARPNAGHVALAQLERAGVVHGVITQNVDGLHQAAGSRRVVELHGALAEVRCLGCGYIEAREVLQEHLVALNPGWPTRVAELAPDGDAELPASVTRGFRVPDCSCCAGVLKPNVVFFGESVPRARVDAAWHLLAAAEVLLVAGSSLAVYSGYRFVRAAARDGKPVVIVNLGPTRGDGEASLCIEGRTGEVLPRLAARFAGAEAGAGRLRATG